MTVAVPDISIVITVVEGEPALIRCLEAISNQVNPPSLEVIVPYDDTIAEVAKLSHRFPAVHFLSLGSVPGIALPSNAFDRHLLYDRFRAAGLRAATGRLLAIILDSAYPEANWARGMVELHDSTSCSVIGGAIENGENGWLQWGSFFCDFGRYQPPLQQDDPEYVSDVNICYKREALEGVRELWEQAYQEPAVNWELRRRGVGLRLSDRAIVVQHRRKTSLWQLVNERVHHGRLFGQIRGRASSLPECIVRAVFTPFLPTLLFMRHLGRQLLKRRKRREFVQAIPIILVLLHFWSFGEFIGYCDAAIGHIKSRKP